MRKLFAVLFCALLAGCASSPKIIPYNADTFIATGEAEYNYSGMVAKIHATAQDKCERESKSLVIIDMKKEVGGSGWVTDKWMYSILFRCI